MAGLESLLALFLSHLSRSREFLVETFIFFIIPLSNASRKRNEKKKKYRYSKVKYPVLSLKKFTLGEKLLTNEL